MVSRRRRCLPWVQNYLRRGQGLDPLLILVVLLTTSAVTLFVKEVGGKSNGYGKEVKNAQQDNGLNVNFVPPDKQVLAEYKERDRKAQLKRQPLPDKLLETFNPEATALPPKANEVEEVIPEELNTEDFKDLGQELIAPPTGIGMGKMLGNINRMMENSLRYFQDVAEENNGSLMKGMTNKVGSLLVKSLQPSLGKDIASKAGDFGFEKILNIAKTVINEKSGKNRRSLYNHSNQELHEKEQNVDKNAKHSTISKTDERENETPQFRQPLSFEIKKRNNRKNEKEKVKSESVWTKIENFAKKKKRKKTVQNPLWIHQKLKLPGRKLEEKHISDLYNIFSSSNQNIGSSRCSQVVPYTKEGHTVKRDNFGGGQLVCEDLDFKSGFQSRCLIYSFGIGKDWSFEELMAEKGCKVWAFDTVTEKPKNLHPNIRFNQIGLDVSYGKKKINGTQVEFLTLSEIKKKLRHEKTIINFLKLNLDGREWNVLEQLVEKEPLLLNFFQQIGITFYIHGAMRDPSCYVKYLNILKQMPSLGFQAFGSVQIEDDLEDLYSEPMLHNKRVSLKNYVAYFRI